MERIRTVIMGAAGRDFHNFNVVYREDPSYDVVAFTAAQIPNIDGRRYPASLAGPLYPDGIPIHPESELESLIQAHRIREVVFAYSDVPYTYVMDRCSIANAAGASFRLLGAAETMLKSTKLGIDDLQIGDQRVGRPTELVGHLAGNLPRAWSRLWQHKRHIAEIAVSHEQIRIELQVQQPGTGRVCVCDSRQMNVCLVRNS